MDFDFLMANTPAFAHAIEPLSIFQSKNEPEIGQGVKGQTAE